WVRRRRSDDFARRGADALRQRSGVQAHRQAHCDDRVTEHRHCRSTQYGPAPTRIAAAARVPVTAEAVTGTLLIGEGTVDGHESAAFIEIEACRIDMVCVYAHV